MAVFVGIDLGGTKTMVAAADQAGTIVRRTRVVTPLDLQEGLHIITQMIVEVAGGETVKALGVAIGGPLDWRTGVVSPLHQPQWRDVPLKALFEQTFGCPLYVDVDTNVAALGEYTFGGERADRLLYLTLSTGMGGGFLMDGQIYRGQDGTHPEVGHQAVPLRRWNPEQVVCPCGARGCLEAVVSGNGIRQLYGKRAEDLDGAEWEEVAYHLGQGLRNLATIYLPDVIVLGGGVVVGAGDRLLDPARQVMREQLKLVPHPAVHLSNLGYDTALRGAVALALDGAAHMPIR